MIAILVYRRTKMNYTATLHSSLTNKKLCKVTFDCTDPLLIQQYAKSAAGYIHGIRNVQYLIVRDVKVVIEKDLS